MPMVHSLDTIFRGLADTYQYQGRGGRQGEDPWGDFDGRDQHDQDHDEQRYQQYGPGRRLYPRDANAPQPMAPPFGTLGEYVHAAFTHLKRVTVLTTLVYLNSFARTSAAEVQAAQEEARAAASA